MALRRGIYGLLIAALTFAAFAIVDPAPARAETELDPWILYLLMLEGDPDTPDLITKPGGDPSDLDPNWSLVGLDGELSPELIARFMSILMDRL